MLFWRHVAFYLDPERVDAARPDVGLGLADTLKARNNNSVNISAFDVPTLRENLSYEFRRLSEKVTGLNLVSFFQTALELFSQAPDPGFSLQSQKSVGPSWRQRESYIGVVVRRLMELLLLDREE